MSSENITHVWSTEFALSESTSLEGKIEVENKYEFLETWGNMSPKKPTLAAALCLTEKVPRCCFLKFRLIYTLT